MRRVTTGRPSDMGRARLVNLPAIVVARMHCPVIGWSRTVVRPRPIEPSAASAEPSASTPNSASNQPQRNTSPRWSRYSERSEGYCGMTARSG